MHTAATHLGRVGAGGQAAVCLGLQPGARWQVDRVVSLGPRLGLRVVRQELLV